uniref:Ribosomal protein S13 n=1 Tax=Histiona aroides TaxID=392300 RepID=M4QBU4_HISAR|nr:ribosomal protein S13 [Histiona aroides]AGH24059.1 ribosomal protein S13 [Histiona aroides]
MVHIFGITMNANKRLPYALRSIYGLGDKRVSDICSYMGISEKLKITDLSDAQISKMCRFIEQSYLIETELRKNQSYNLKRLLDIKSYRGLRHVHGLPVRGQRTHTNAKTQKALSKRRGIKNITT